MNIKYKNNIRIELEDGSILRIYKRNHKYQITGFDKDLNLLPVKTYQSLERVKKYMLETYGVELE